MIEWAELTERQQAKLTERLHIACVATRPLTFRQIRPIDAVPGISEIKVENPLLRAFAFKIQRAWFITQIEPKPKKRLVIEKARKSSRLRDEYLLELQNAQAQHPKR